MLSVIIPVLNEAPIIHDVLEELTQKISDKYRVEIILVDGGSIDGTVGIISNFIKNNVNPKQATFTIQLITSAKGRAKQMNFGAKHANSNVLYFLHADTSPPKHFDKYIMSKITQGTQAGCFRMKFNSNHWWLKLAGWCTRFNWKICRGGDQSLFISKALFNEIGGYNEDYIIYEDNIMIDEIYKRKKFVVLPKKVTTSARLYKQKGILNLQYHFWAIHAKKRLGADSKALYNYYSKNIKGLDGNYSV
ncbi:MAG: glycosyl transferase family 2 [Aequorivita sp.]|nr:glycosyl transferase family 2 [Aequorivita sp.]|tara:strand:- start:5984 stop:6727 length:744 start_codon:yes stop_codon:yes gene_type:complete